MPPGRPKARTAPLGGSKPKAQRGGISDMAGMVRDSRRTGLSGPLLVRLLTRLAEVEVLESGQSASDCLSLWLGWTDAIALSAALSGAAPSVPPAARAADGGEMRDCAELRAVLSQSILDDATLVAARRRWQARASAAAVADYSMYRQRYLAMQQAMEREIGALRTRLRETLAAGGEGQRRLAALDAIMGQVLSERENRVLAGIPSLLEGYFERLQAAPPGQADAAVDWQDLFRKDMQRVLLAELDIRWQPVEGLMAAVRDGGLAVEAGLAAGN